MNEHLRSPSESFESYPTAAQAADLEAASNPLAETIDRIYGIEASRRKLLAGATMALGTVVFGIRKDTQYAMEHSPKQDLSIDIVKPSIDTINDQHATIFIPPFNFPSAAPFAEAVQDTVAEFGSVAALSHDNLGFSVDNCAQKVHEFVNVNNLRSITLYGSSVGGLIATVIASRIPEVTHLIVDSAPASIGNVKQLPQLVPPELAAIADQMGLTGGPVTRASFEFAKRMYDGGKSLQDCFNEAIAQIDPTKCPNAVDIDLFWFLATHTASAQSDRLRNRQIDIDYLGAANVENDTLVDQRAAANSYKELARATEVNFGEHRSVGTGHTDMPHHPKEYNSLLHDALLSWQLRHTPPVYQGQRTI